MASGKKSYCWACHRDILQSNWDKHVETLTHRNQPASVKGRREMAKRTNLGTATHSKNKRGRSRQF